MSVHRSNASFALWVLFAINAINFFDRQILGAVGIEKMRPIGWVHSSLATQSGYQHRRKTVPKLKRLNARK
jgi:hypothetical protein